ncbi:MAG: RecX family transcriptional regulator [Acetobacterales bacterium]
MHDSESTSPSGRERRPPKKATERYLDNAARWYLDRYGGTCEGLRRALMRRVRRSQQAHDTDPEEGRAAVERIISRFLAAGLLDDSAYARGKANALRGRGDSGRQIAAKLRAKGVDPDAIQMAVRNADADNPLPELRAAARAAQRRRLGPWRDPRRRAERRERDLAALARQGFAFHVARAVIDASSPEALETEIREREAEACDG